MAPKDWHSYGGTEEGTPIAIKLDELRDRYRELRDEDLKMSSRLRTLEDLGSRIDERVKHTGKLVWLLITGVVAGFGGVVLAMLKG